jgi:hypothetical protein
MSDVVIFLSINSKWQFLGFATISSSELYNLQLLRNVQFYITSVQVPCGLSWETQCDVASCLENSVLKLWIGRWGSVEELKLVGAERVWTLKEKTETF